MAYGPDSITTGLLGYKLRKELFGDGLYFRQVETYNYDISATPGASSSTPYEDIEDNIKSYFSSRSGDLTVKVLESPADYQFPNDHVRLGRFNVEVEIRKPLASPATYSPELSTDYYKGYDGTFLTTYGPYFNDFKEDFVFEQGENGKDIYAHTINFSLNSGNKTIATTIAQNIFANDQDTTFGINVLAGGASVANTGNYQNYYTESYDLLRNSFSFTKRRELLPLASSPYTYDLGHSIIFKEDGVIDVSERGSVNGQRLFTQAQQGYGALFTNAYTRCNAVYNSYKNLIAGGTISSPLINTILSTNRVMNRAALTIDYEVNFTNNPSLLEGGPAFLDETIEIDRSENKIININHSYDFNLMISPVPTGIDSTHISLITNADTASPAKISGYYAASSIYDESRPIRRIQRNSSAGTRRKNLNISFNYTNNPIYFVVLDGVEYAILDYRINTTIPVDIVSEYKVINRTTKTSVLNYAYQTERGSKSVSLTAKLNRDTSSNVFTNPRNNLSANLLSLYKFAVGKVLQTLTGNNTLSLTYYLSDLKYSINSDDDITIELFITYTNKKYKAE